MGARVYAYIRTSTVKQGTEGVSLEAQRDAISSYARRHDLSIVEWFSETQTAAKRGRPVFARMMRGLKQRRVEGLILHRIDRGSRNLKDWSDIADLTDLGLQVHFAHDSLDLATRGGRLAADVQAVVAADFVRNLREETKKGMLGRLKQGLWPWKAPLGYRDNGRAMPKSVDPVEGPLVRKAYELYASGRYNFHMLRDTLFDLGLRTPAGKRLSLHGLTSLLTNPFYYGMVHVAKWNEHYQGRHEPIVAKSLFDAVQDVLHGRTRHKNIKHEHLYRRDISCRTCKYKLLGETQKGHVYYRCHTRTCPKTSLKQEMVTASLERDLAHLADFVSTHPELAVLLTERLAQAKLDRESTLQALKLQLTQLDSRMSAATDALLDGLIDKEAYATKRSELLDARASINESITRHQAGEVVGADLAYLYLELEKRLRLRAFCGSPRFARDMCKRAASNFIASGKTVELQWNQAFKKLIEHAKTPPGDPDRCAHRTLEEWADLLMGFDEHPHVPLSQEAEMGAISIF